MAYRDNHGTTAHPTAARTPFAAGDTFLTGTPASRVDDLKRIGSGWCGGLLGQSSADQIDQRESADSG